MAEGREHGIQRCRPRRRGAKVQVHKLIIQIFVDFLKMGSSSLFPIRCLLLPCLLALCSLASDQLASELLHVFDDIKHTIRFGEEPEGPEAEDVTSGIHGDNRFCVHVDDNYVRCMEDLALEAGDPKFSLFISDMFLRLERTLPQPEALSMYKASLQRQCIKCFQGQRRDSCLRLASLFYTLLGPSAITFVEEKDPAPCNTRKIHHDLGMTLSIIADVQRQCLLHEHGHYKDKSANISVPKALTQLRTLHGSFQLYERIHMTLDHRQLSIVFAAAGSRINRLEYCLVRDLVIPRVLSFPELLLASMPVNYSKFPREWLDVLADNTSYSLSQLPLELATAICRRLFPPRLNLKMIKLHVLFCHVFPADSSSSLTETVAMKKPSKPFILSLLEVIQRTYVDRVGKGLCSFISRDPASYINGNSDLLAGLLVPYSCMLAYLRIFIVYLHFLVETRYVKRHLDVIDVHSLAIKPSSKERRSRENMLYSQEASVYLILQENVDSLCVQMEIWLRRINRYFAQQRNILFTFDYFGVQWNGYELPITFEGVNVKKQNSKRVELYVSFDRAHNYVSAEQTVLQILSQLPILPGCTEYDGFKDLSGLDTTSLDDITLQLTNEALWGTAFSVTPEDGTLNGRLNY
jgi:hypothetical protein